MKKLVCVLITVILLATCMSASAQVDLEAFRQANIVSAIPDVYPSFMQQAVYYDPQTGEAIDHTEVYNHYDEDSGLRITFVYANGDVAVWGGGEAYGYVSQSNQPYLCAFAGCAYEEMMRSLGTQNIGEFYGGEVITAEETVPNGNLLLTVETPITGDMADLAAFAGATLVASYTVNPDNLVILSSNVAIRGDDGVLMPYIALSITFNPEEYELPFDLAPLREPEAKRELHIIMDPGTDAEFDYVAEAPLNIPLSVLAPEAYGLYDDAAGTVPTKGTPPDANGNYPLTAILYCVATEK